MEDNMENKVLELLCFCRWLESLSKKLRIASHSKSTLRDNAIFLLCNTQWLIWRERQATRLVARRDDTAAAVEKDHIALLDSVLSLIGHCWVFQRKFDNDNHNINKLITAFMANGGLLAILMRTAANWYAQHDEKRLTFEQVKGMLHTATCFLSDLAIAYELALLNFDLDGTWGYANFMALKTIRRKVGGCLAQLDKLIKEMAGQVFELPKSQPSRPLKPCQRLGVFLDFLRANLEELLKCKIEWTNPELADSSEAFRIVLLQYRIKLIASDMDRIELLRKELSFLITFVGDMPLQSPMFEYVKKLNLWNEIEAMADKTGKFCYLLFTGNMQEMSLVLSDILQEIELIKEDMKDYLVALHPLIFRTLRVTDEIVIGLANSLLEHLKVLLEHKTDLILPVKSEIVILDKELMPLRSFLMNIKDGKAVIEDWKEVATHIASFIKMVEYLIDSFVVQGSPVWYFNIRFSQAIKEIELIKKKVAEVEQKNKFSTGAQMTSTRDSFHAPTPVLTKITMNYVLEETIKEQLTRDARGLELISIVGMPGLGKTTLAKKIYHDLTILYKFHVRVWCSVSQAYDRRGLLLDIIGSVTNGMYQKSEESSELKIGMSQESEESSELRVGMPQEIQDVYELRDERHQNSEEDSVLNKEKCTREEDAKRSNKMNEMSEEDLARYLYQLLKGKRYIIVMDDIWDTKPWDDFKVCLPDDNTGSRILFTSRSKDLHLQGKHHTTFRHPFLSQNGCWYLLRHNVFQNGECLPELEDVGKEIARKCQGLPILVNLVAGLLGRMERRLSLWEEFSGSLSSYIAKDTNVSEQILEQSYKHLQDNLRQCFLYFGGFPKERPIPVQKLIRLWIAEGFILKTTDESLECVAERCLTDLINRNLVLVVDRRSDGRIKTCRIHALLHDFCLKKAEEENFLKTINGQFPLYESPHRVAILNPRCPDSMLCSPHIRSFLCLFPNGPDHLFSNTSFLFHSSRLLKVLDLECINTPGYLPSAIGKLVLLKYLAVAGNFRILPSSIRNLWNLETFIVKSPLSCLPDVILGMPKLRHLQIEVPSTSLSSKIPLYKQRAIRFSAMQTLGTICIDCAEVEEFLRCFPNLRKLKCSFHVIWEIDSTPHLPVLDFLDHLEVLHVVRIFYEYDMLKDFSSLTLPSSLRQITLTCCYLPWEEISALGRSLPMLEVLKLLTLASAGDEWDMDNDEVEFPELKYLKFENLHLESWKVAYSDQFPRLRKLVLQDCKKLEEIPLSFADIEPLEIQGCNSALVQSAREIEEIQHGFGNEPFRVLIHAADYGDHDDGFGD